MKLIITELLVFLLLLLSAGCVDEDQSTGTGTATQAPLKTSPIATPVQPSGIPAALTSPQQQVNTVSPAEPADPRLRNPLKMEEGYLFGNGTKWISEVKVNRFWMNDSYRWYNPEELQYDTRTAPAGKKYLFVFLSFVNYGTQRAPLPPQGNIYILFDNVMIPPYVQHPLPMKNPDSTPRVVRIAEIEYSHKVYSSELVEDYGYSHGQKLEYIAPGESNAVEGYIIYEVPASLTPEKAYVLIVLPDKNQAVWILR